MKRIELSAPGPAEAMKLIDLPDPTPGEGQCLVRVEAAGVNFIDVYHRGGVYPLPAPIRPGREGAGVVEAVGAGVTDVKVGDRVAWCDQQGSYATHIAAKAERLVPVPEGVSARDAAAVMLQGMTAHYLAHDTFPLKDGHACLVHAAAGGVGLLLCQMASTLGARVFGTTSTEEKAALARENGADEVFVTSDGDFFPAVKAFTYGKGVHVAYDGVGLDTWERSLTALRPRGMLVLFGQSSGVVPPIDPWRLMHQGSVFLTRPSLPHYTAERGELLARAGAVLGAVGRGELKVHVGGSFPLSEAHAAHAMLEGRRSTGKVLLDCAV